MSHVWIPQMLCLAEDLEFQQVNTGGTKEMQGLFSQSNEPTIIAVINPQILLHSVKI